MARKLKSDKILFLATLLLVASSIVMVWSASAVMALQRFSQPYLFLTKQAMWAALGIALLGIVMRIDYRLYKQQAVVWGLLAVTAAALVAVLFSPPINNTRRWFGIAGVGIQPSELAKLTLAIFVAWMLERRMHRVNDMFYSLVPLAVITVPIVGLVLLEPDFGSAMTILAIVGAMVFAAGLSMRYLVGLSVVGLPLVAVVLMSADYRRKRLLSFLDPWADPLGDGYQIIQSLIAVGSGGIFGQGLMGGVQKLFYLPEPHTDFIYAVVAEELGFVGSSAVVLCFCLIAWRGLRAAASAPDRFGALLAVGLTTMIAVQAFVNISVVLGLLPTKGIPLPFVSAGGSSLLISLVSMGILLNISQHASAAES
jgi:cell division protein FtsW